MFEIRLQTVKFLIHKIKNKSVSLGKELVLAIELNNTTVELLVNFLRQLENNLKASDQNRAERIALKKLIDLYDNLYEYYHPNNFVIYKLDKLFAQVIPLVENSLLATEDVDTANAIFEHSLTIKKYVKGSVWKKFYVSFKNSWNLHQDSDDLY